ncbi:molybdenum cofactor guanylyltransferase [Dermacoccaceae bacterium W4C1]
MTTSDAGVVVLAGGAARRFGSDKLAADLDGTSLLRSTLRGLPPGWPVVCVGAARPGFTDVAWAQEDAPGSGPYAGALAGLACLDTPNAAVIAGDMPLAGAALPLLRAALTEEFLAGGVTAARALDASGRAQPLLVLVDRAAALAAAYGDPAGRPARALLEPLEVIDVPVAGDTVFDIDSPDDLDAFRRR